MSNDTIVDIAVELELNKIGICLVSFVLYGFLRQSNPKVIKSNEITLLSLCHAIDKN